MMATRVFFYVQHLLGIGHLKRAATIARAAAADGLNVIVAMGGPPVPGVDFGNISCVQLPPVQAGDEEFRTLIDARGQPIDEAWRVNRRNALIEAFEAADPDILLFELFPFGRRQFRFEILPLIEAARSASRPPAVMSSVRDVLVHNAKPARIRETLDLVRGSFDLVLVHGDPDRQAQHQGP